MSYTFPGGARRPIIDINSENLVFIWNLPRWIDIGDIKRSLQPKYGRIKFVETFEAWRDGKRMGQIILDFATSSALSDFARAISSKEEFSNYEGVEFMRFDPKIGQRPFFNFVRQQTGVDLLECGGVPPSFQYKRKDTYMERNMNPNNIPLQPRGRAAYAMHDDDGGHRNGGGDGRTDGGQTRPPPSRGTGRAAFGPMAGQFSNGGSSSSSHRPQRQFVPPVVEKHSDEPKDAEDADGGFGQRGSRTVGQRGSAWFGQRGGGGGLGQSGGGAFGQNGGSAAEVVQSGGGVEEVGREKEASFDAVGGFGTNPPSRRFSRPKLSFLDEPNGTTNRFEGRSPAAVRSAFGVDEICPEDPEVDAAFGAYRNDDNDEAGTDSVHQQEGQEQKSPSSNDGEEAVKPGGRHPHMDTSFTQYREKSRSREDSVSEDLDGRGSVKNTLKITQLDAGFDITKILEALQTVGEVVYHDRVGKTSAAFTFDDAAEAANASVLVVGDLAAPNALFQLTTPEEAYS